MSVVFEKLERLISTEFRAVDVLFDDFLNNDLIIIELCKALDFYACLSDSKKSKTSSKILKKLQNSFPVLLEKGFKKISFKNHFPKKPSKELGISELLDLFSFQTGNLMTAKILVEQAKAGLLLIEEHAGNVFSIKNTPISSSLEIIESAGWIQYFKRIEKGLYKQRETHLLKEAEIINCMLPLVEPSETAFIRYNTTPEIDDFYSQLGYFEFLSFEPYDLFDENALFGGIEYIKYVNVLMQLVGTGIKHINYCFLLLKKSPQTNSREIFCIHYELKKLIPQYARYMQIPEAQIKQIFNCLTVTPDNINVHVKDHHSFSPIFIKVSENHVMRSVSGTLNSPMLFLMRELKRQFPEDYHRNTEREDIFRTQLYNLFKTTQVLKANLLFVEHEVNINSNGIHTDIDAAVFDIQSQSLALFQLKWQDLYAHDMKERRSRLSNYSKKAEEWIEKMTNWTRVNDSKTVLHALKLAEKVNSKAAGVKNVYLFVINKWNGHFTNFYPDSRAAWTSWYNFLVMMDRVSLSSDNYIRDLYLKIKEEIPELLSVIDQVDDIELKYKTFTIVHKR